MWRIIGRNQTTQTNKYCQVGMLPSPPSMDSLQGDGLARFAQGLRVSTCVAAPSLGMTGASRMGQPTTASLGPFVESKLVGVSKTTASTNWNRISTTLAHTTTGRPTPSKEDEGVCNVVTVVVTTTVF